MAVFRLTEDLGFPDPELAAEDGRLAVDGDLTAKRILNAYSLGIFPWYSEDSRILWWSPNPRIILKPASLKRTKSLMRTIKSGKFTCKFDTNFEAVIRECAKIPRDKENGTWLLEEMIDAYIELHKLGFAHSVETYLNNELVGGLYGLSLGKAFFGESMFFKKSDASKVALSYLCQHAKARGFFFIDAQVETDHIIRMGGEKIKRSAFLELLNQALEHPSCQGKWTIKI